MEVDGLGGMVVVGPGGCKIGKGGKGTGAVASWELSNCGCLRQTADGNADSPGCRHTEYYYTADFERPFGRDTGHSQSFQSRNGQRLL